MYALRSFPKRCGAWPSRNLRKCEFFLYLTIAGKDTGHVHHLTQPEDTLSSGKMPESVCIQHCSANLCGCCRDTGREQVPDVGCCAFPFGKHELQTPVPATLAISWGSATTVVVPWSATSRAYSRGVNNELFDVYMGVYKAGDKVLPRTIVHGFSGIIPDTKNGAVLYCERPRLPGTGERIEYTGVLTDDIRGNETPGCVQQVCMSRRHLVHHNIPDGRGFPLTVLDEIDIEFVLTGFQRSGNNGGSLTLVQGEWCIQYIRFFLQVPFYLVNSDLDIALGWYAIVGNRKRKITIGIRNVTNRCRYACCSKKEREHHAGYDQDCMVAEGHYSDVKPWAHKTMACPGPCSCDST